MSTKKRDAEASAPAPAQQTTPDVALIQGPTADGEGLQILRARENRLELGALRPLREGVPITGEVVTLRPRENFPALCDVETHFTPPERSNEAARALPPAPRSGPAQVATDEYRRNWDAIWNQRADKPKLSN